MSDDASRRTPAVHGGEYVRNYYKCRFNYKPDDISISTLYIEPTNICNISCIYCPRKNMTRNTGYMNINLYKKIIDEAASLDIELIRLFLYGEPLLHPDIIEMIKYAKSKNLTVNFNTNSTLLTQSLSNDIINTELDSIIFSVDSIYKNIYEKMRKGSRFDLVINNIKTFKELRDKKGTEEPYITVQTMKTTDTTNEKSVDFWSKYSDMVSIGYLGAIRDKNDILYKLQEKKSPLKRNKLCTLLWESLVVYWNGDVTVCCADYNGEYIIGNIKNNTLSQILKSPKLYRIKEYNINKEFNKIPFCNTCDSGYLESEIFEIATSKKI